jgi:hypothetical protein
MSVAQAIQQRKNLATEKLNGILPLRSEVQISRGYILPKAKCYKDGTYQCTRTHEHDRTIVAAARDPISRLNKRAARALLVLVKQKFGDKVGHSVRNQLLLGQEIQNEHPGLRKTPCTACNICGKTKNCVECCKLDASSFFTRCPREQCIANASALVQSFIDRGADTIWISKEDKRDKIAKSNTPIPQRYTSMRLVDLLKILEFCLTDNLVLVGKDVWVQHNGLGQGNAFSPILTRLLLDITHAKMWKTPQSFQDSPLRLLRNFGKPISGLLGLKFHVDDSIWWSFEICTSCITSTVERVWPQQIGLTVEETTYPMVFLHAVVTFDTHGNVHISSRNQNSAFSRGETAHPQVCGLPPYIKHICSYRSLAITFSTRLWLLSGFSRPELAHDSIKHIVLLATEALRLNWSTRHVVAQLCYHRNHRFRWFHRWTRACGVWLRRNRHGVSECRHRPQGEPSVWNFLVEKWIRDSLGSVQ